MRGLCVLAALALWSEARAFADPIAPDLNSVAAKLTFEPGKTSLTTAAKTALGPLLDALQTRRSTHLVIVGHFGADARVNMEVTARRRADVVKWFLVDRGIETDRIETSVSSVIVPGRIIELQLGELHEQAPRPRPAAVRAPPAPPAVVGPVVPTPTVAAPSVAAIDSSGPDPRLDTRDASQMAELLGDAPSVKRRTAGANLAAEIAAAHAQSITVGGGESESRGGDPVHLEAAPSVLDLGMPTLLRSIAKHTEVDHDRTVPGSVSVDAALAPLELIRHKLYAHYIRRVSRCYRKVLASRPDLSGLVTLSFTIDGGTVVAAAAETDDPDLRSCMRSQMKKTWRFDPTRERTGVRETLTMVLQAN